MGTFLKWFDNGFLFLLTKREYVCTVSAVLADLPCNRGEGPEPFSVCSGCGRSWLSRGAVIPVCGSRQSISDNQGGGQPERNRVTSPDPLSFLVVERPRNLGRFLA